MYSTSLVGPNYTEYWIPKLETRDRHLESFQKNQPECSYLCLVMELFFVNVLSHWSHE